MKKDICKLIGIKYPIFQGAMTFVSDKYLVAAVSNAGGLGIFAPGDDSARGGAEWLREQIQSIRKLTDKPFGVNLPIRSPIIADMVNVLCEEKVKVATTGGGNPAPYIAQMKEAGIIVAPVVPDAKTTLKMQQAGADMVIASGMEAGGFVGNVTTMVTLPQITSAVDIPVVAAGGIADGKGLAAAIAMGASGVQMGTRFMLSKECTIPEVFKVAMIKATSKDAVAVHSKLRNGPALRVLRNKVVDDLLAYEKENHAEASVYEDKFDSSRYEHFLREGRVDELLLGMGEVAGSIHEILSVEDIINNMIKEYEDIVKDMPSFS